MFFWIPCYGSFLDMDLYENKYISIWGFEEPGFFGSIFFWHMYVGPGPFKVGVSMIFFGCFGSLVMGPSWIWILMKINISLFEGLKSQDFMDPDFSDTCMWVQDPHKHKWNYGYPHFEGSWTHIYMSEKYGSKKSWLLKPSNRNIFIFIKIHIEEGPITRDPKHPKKSWIAPLWRVLDPHTWVGKIWIQKILALKILK